MELSEEQRKAYSRRILMSRMRILTTHGFYGVLLMHIKFILSDAIEIAAFGVQNNEYSIHLNPKILETVTDKELDFLLMHEILHIALQHDTRGKDLIPEQFNVACDIVVNSNILRSCNMDESAISLSVNGGVAEHLAPNGNEGYLYTAEEVYEMLTMTLRKPIKGPGSGPKDPSGKPDKTNGDKPGEANTVPDENTKTEQNPDGFDVHGCEDETDDEVSSASPKEPINGLASGSENPDENTKTGQNPDGFDVHGFGNERDDDASGVSLKDLWDKYLADACEAMSVRDAVTGCGSIPLLAQRRWEEMRRPQTDWRTILNEFVQEEICDYSFAPPDRRFCDSPFFLPDFNEKEDTVENILFMIDTSGSMSNKEITAAFCEIKGALEQFNGKLKGWLGFFDADVVPPIPFENVEELCVIRPEGGGGTNFDCVFEYVRECMEETPPASIIILTDGYAPFPEECAADGIPVLWLLNNTMVDPPWGKVARITV